MPVPAPSHHRTHKDRALPSAVPLLLLAAAAVAGGAAVSGAPDPARPWVAATVAVAWGSLALVVVSGVLLLRAARRRTATARGEVEGVRTQLAGFSSALGHLLNVSLPAAAGRLREGAGAQEARAAVPAPAEPQLRRVLELFTQEIADARRLAATAAEERDAALRQLTGAGDALGLLAGTTLPEALTALRAGRSADTVLATVQVPADPRLRTVLTTVVRDFATSERRAAAAQAASAKALTRVQAKAVSMLADLRDMQDRHGEDVFGDLLRLDHNTSQIGLLTDRLALLMGGRASRAWNKPIPMESILRGAVGRIVAYQRVRLNCSSNAAIAGFAAEPVMHLLAELMDNAANFSPPIDQVHVYVEERTAGIVVTIEDSGLKMAGAAMRRAEESVSGNNTDLALLQGTRLGLAVVGRLAAKYHISVNYRPSSRGGTGVVVLLPPQLLAQQRDPAPGRARPVPEATPLATAAPAVTRAAPPAPGPAASPAPPTSQTARPATSPAGPSAATTGGLPVRPPGRTMAAADQGRTRPPAGRPESAPSGRDAGSQFGAFHRARRTPDSPSAQSPSTPSTSPDRPSAGPTGPAGPADPSGPSSAEARLQPPPQP
ncbi:ATP-binding protein [Streptomyces sp. NPDC059142]|uniref:sensor histidine kinase n=1 Tax=Streptomyces sp. NPDC059142 TaxID=3346739 RepID=UPI0036C2B601